jgi:hypothetical protein
LKPNADEKYQALTPPLSQRERGFLSSFPERKSVLEGKMVFKSSPSGRGFR